MKHTEWHEAYVKLADAYYHATGEIVTDRPECVVVPVTEETLKELYVDTRRRTDTGLFRSTGWLWRPTSAATCAKTRSSTISTTTARITGSRIYRS